MINIKRGDRALFVGTTGSGKTLAAGSLLVGQPDVIVLDPKQQFEWPKGKEPANGIVTKNPKEVLAHAGPSPLVFRPSLTMAKMGMEWFWRWVWERGNTLVYIDETTLLCKSRTILSDGMGRAIQQGRQRDVGVWCATQRPANIPIPILSESEHMFIFRLRNPADLKRMSDYSDPKVMQDPSSGHDFWYYNDRDQTLEKLNLNKVRIR